ncbi:hypothetical protein KOM00_03975 [Geomonas sp. Red69]|uniref:Pilus assembly protein FimV n=1 Tax=Geomonas diazotrophica TaxID=2843197 RepID=A0ABX8JG04_9BACT|nr:MULTISPECIES: hypothetical protein [Geomonas]MBU5635883.1 hypothetical protein [Geomonas diazotrophica]QWV96921.1 hypothetical protein KP005_16445 [Geomonas nitrogeniifigens]QXE86097.1 hypothetical protein KP003_17295 [Geomonas nitrogeniifigens]
MRRIIFLLAFCVFIPTAAFAGGLEVFLSNVNVQARADLPGFSLGLSTQFGVPVTQVQAVIRSVPEPADAFMVLQLGQMSHRRPESVLAIYQPNRKKGWGAIAKELGIKPGSPEFHALKNGDLHFTGGSAERGGGRGDGPGNGHRGGHGRGHNKS